MALIDTDKLSPSLQVLISLALENNEMKQEIDQLRKELDELKERILNGNDFSKYPASLKITDIAEILRVSKASAYQLSRQAAFPKIKDGRIIIIPKAAFIKWMDTEAFSGMQYIKGSGINGKK